jgi:hypothetical protein
MASFERFSARTNKFVIPVDIKFLTEDDYPRAYAKSLLSGASVPVSKPCATRGKRFSDVKNYSVFGLGLGMTFDEAKQIIDQSGYFPEKTTLTRIKGCHSNNAACVGYIFARKDGISLSVDFDASSDGDESHLVVSQILLWFDPAANPYFDPIGLEVTFIKLFGAPDRTQGSNAFWGDPQGRNIRVYTSEPDRNSVVVLEGKHPTRELYAPTRIARN